jgi:hypothetical protein
MGDTSESAEDQYVAGLKSRVELAEDEIASSGGDCRRRPSACAPSRSDCSRPRAS